MADNIKLYSGYDFFLILKNGTLYGIGSNTCHQLSEDDDTYYFGPVFIADNVISASAGREYSGYITSDGTVKILGTGRFADNPVHIDNAKNIFVSQNNQFMIEDGDGNFFGFGDNSNESVCARTRTRVYEENNIEKTMAYGSSVTKKYSSVYHTVGYFLRTEEDNRRDLTNTATDDFKKTELSKRLYEENYHYNIAITTELRDYSYDEKTYLSRGVIDISVDIVNFQLLQPVKLTEDEAQRLKCMKAEEYGERHDVSEDFGFTKLLVNSRKCGLAINRAGKLITADTAHGNFSIPRVHLDSVQDIAVLHSDDYDNNYIILTGDGELLLGNLGSIFPVTQTAGTMIRDSIANALFSKRTENAAGGHFNEFQIRRLILPED